MIFSNKLLCEFDQFKWSQDKEQYLVTSSLGVSNKRLALFQMSHAGIHHTLKFFMKFLNANMDGRFSILQGIDGVCINIYGLVVRQYRSSLVSMFKDERQHQDTVRLVFCLA